MMTIAQQLKVTEFPFEIHDSNGNQIYIENSRGEWERFEYDSNRVIYTKRSNGYWSKKEYGSNNRGIYYENSNGVVTDNRPKPVTELTMDDIAAKFNIPVSQLKIIK